MNLSPNKVWTSISRRRFVSLFITVIWLATALQPCVMASVVDSHSACPHCKNTVSDKNPCDPQSDKNCDSDETLVFYERIKPVDTEKLYGKFQSFSLNNSQDVKVRFYSTPASTISKSLDLPTGPPLRDLYQVYLK